MNRSTDSTKTLADLWQLLLHHRWRFIMPAFLAVACVLTAGYVLPRRYQAQAILERRTDMVLTEITHRGATQSFQDPRGAIVEELTSDPAIAAAVEEIRPDLIQLGLLPDRIDPDQLRAELSRGLIVHWDIASREFDRLRLEYVGTNPKVASLAVNALVQQYIDRTRSAMDRRLAESASFFESEVESWRSRIAKIEGELLQFEVAHAELLPDNPANVQLRLAEAENRLTELRAERDAMTMRAEALRERLKETPESTPTLVRGRNPRIDELEQRQRALEGELRELVSVQKMTRKHPDVQAVRKQIEQVQAELEQTDEQVVTQTHLSENPRRASLELSLTEIDTDQQGLARQAASLEAQVEQLRTEAERMFPVRSRYQRLRREMDDAHRQLAFWEENLRRVQLARTAEAGNRGIQMSFIQRATPAKQPVSPDLAQLLAAALLVGGAAGTLGIFFAQRGDQSFHRGEDVAEMANLPLLGTVSELVTHRYRLLRKLRHATFYPAGALVMGSIILLLLGGLYLDLRRPDAMGRVGSEVSAVLKGGKSPVAALASLDLTGNEPSDHEQKEPF
ncbi:MAG: GumC family protein [Phycisphaeraceae bacterium]